MSEKVLFLLTLSDSLDISDILMSQLATLCYIRKNGQTLMLHRIKKENDTHKGKWNGLGGKVEQGETPEECVIREVKEECGLTIINPYLKGLLTFPQNDWRVFIFLAENFTGRLTSSNEGVLQWIDNEKLMDLNLWPGDRIFMKWLDKEQFFSAKFVYKGEEVADHHVVFYD